MNTRPLTQWEYASIQEAARELSIKLLCRPVNISMEKKENPNMTKHYCEGKPQHNPHPRTEMQFIKSWTLQGQNQKKPMSIEMYRCPIEHCHKYLRVAIKD